MERTCLLLYRPSYKRISEEKLFNGFRLDEGAKYWHRPSRDALILRTGVALESLAAMLADHTGYSVVPYSNGGYMSLRVEVLRDHADFDYRNCRYNVEVCPL